MRSFDRQTWSRDACHALLCMTKAMTKAEISAAYECAWVTSFERQTPLTKFLSNFSWFYGFGYILQIFYNLHTTFQKFWNYPSKQYALCSSSRNGSTRNSNTSRWNLLQKIYFSKDNFRLIVVLALFWIHILKKWPWLLYSTCLSYTCRTNHVLSWYSTKRYWIVHLRRCCFGASQQATSLKRERRPH